LGPPRKFTDLGPEALERLAREDVPDTVKAFNLIKALVDEEPTHSFPVGGALGRGATDVAVRG
jgi:hypothetical protein